MNKAEIYLEIIKLANFFDIDYESLTIDTDVSDYEQTLVKYAHNFREGTQLQVMMFLSKGIIPKAISKEIVFKSLKFNEEFFLQHWLYIKQTSWMREELYESKEENNKKTVNFDLPSFYNRYAIRAASNDKKELVIHKILNTTNFQLNFELAKIYLNEADETDRVFILVEDTESLFENQFEISICQESGEIKSKADLIQKRNGSSIELSADIPRGSCEIGDIVILTMK